MKFNTHITSILLACTLVLPFSVSLTHSAESSDPSMTVLPDMKDSGPSPQTIVDRTHKAVTTRLNSAVNYFDNFFSNPRIDEEAVNSQFRIKGIYTLHEFNGHDYKAKFKARLNLPNLKNRINLTIDGEGNNVENLIDNTLSDTESDTEQEEAQKTSFGLQYIQSKAQDYGLSHRVTFKYNDGVQTKFSTRIRFSYPVTTFSLIQLTQFFFWEDLEGFGEETRLDYNYFITPKDLFRYTIKGLFAEKSAGYEWLTGGQLSHATTRNQAIAAGLFFTGETRPENVLNRINLFIRYRTRFLKDWIFFEITPEVEWPRERNYRSAGILTMGLEFVL